MTHWIGKRMSFSMGLSLLLHGLILFMLSFGLLPKGERNGGATLVVRLVPHALEKIQPDELKREPLEVDKSKYVIATSIHSTNKTAHPKTEAIDENIAEPRQQAVPTTTTDTPLGSTDGVAIPKALSLPWMQGLEVRPVSKHEAPETNMPMTGEMRARQQAMMHTQMLMSQLNVSISRRLIENGKNISGSCDFSDAVEGQSLTLVCTPATLDALLKSQKFRMREALLMQAKAGKASSGLNINFNEGRLGISFREVRQESNTLP